MGSCIFYVLPSFFLSQAFSRFYSITCHIMRNLYNTCIEKHHSKNHCIVKVVYACKNEYSNNNITSKETDFYMYR